MLAQCLIWSLRACARRDACNATVPRRRELQLATGAFRRAPSKWLHRFYPASSSFLSRFTKQLHAIWRVNLRNTINKINCKTLPNGPVGPAADPFLQYSNNRTGTRIYGLFSLGLHRGMQVCPADVHDRQQQQPRSLSLSLLLSFVAGNFNFVEPS